MIGGPAQQKKHEFGGLSYARSEGFEPQATAARQRPGVMKRTSVLILPQLLICV